MNLISLTITSLSAVLFQDKGGPPPPDMKMGPGGPQPGEVTPIDDNIWMLLIAGVLIGGYYAFLHFKSRKTAI